MTPDAQLVSWSRTELALCAGRLTGLCHLLQVVGALAAAAVPPDRCLSELRLRAALETDPGIEVIVRPDMGGTTVRLLF